MSIPGEKAQFPFSIGVCINKDQLLLLEREAEKRGISKPAFIRALLDDILSGCDPGEEVSDR